MCWSNSLASLASFASFGGVLSSLDDRLWWLFTSEFRFFFGRQFDRFFGNLPCHSFEFGKKDYFVQRNFKRLTPPSAIIKWVPLVSFGVTYSAAMEEACK